MNDNIQPNSERPRLTPAERAARKKRLRRKKRFRIALVIAFFALVLAVIISPIVIFTAFRVKTITVSGKTPYTETEIISVSGTAVGKNLVTADAEAIADNIKAGLPYVFDVTVTKKLPGTLILEVTKATEDYAVYLEDTKAYLLLDKELNILKTAAECPKDATVIRCAAPVSQKEGDPLAFAEVDGKSGKEQTEDTLLAALNSIIDSAKAEKLSHITLIDLRDSADAVLVYDGRILLQLGSLYDIPSKIGLAAKSLAQENTINPTQIGTLNLTISKKAFFEPDVFDYLMPGEVPPPEEEETNGDDPEEGTADDDDENSSDESNDNTDENTADNSNPDENGGQDSNPYKADEGEVG